MNGFGKTISIVALLASPSVGLAQAQPESSENGAVGLSIAGGWSFKLPANRAIVSTPGGTAISPEKTTLAAPSFGATVTAWKFLVPFFELAAYDAGKATAAVGTFKSEVEGTIFTINGGIRLVAGRSKVRPYAEFGGGVLRQNLKSTFTSGSSSTQQTLDGSIGNLMYGGGVQLFAGRKWGADIGFDGFHARREFATGGQNFSRIRIGVFYQTKSAIP